MLKIISNLQEEAMGKKKSVALIVLISLILAVLLAMSVASFSVPSTVKNYNSLLSVIDLGCDLGGGYQTVMYPEGVISKEEYQSLVEADEASAEDYTAYKGVYLSTDIYSNNEISETFQSEFDTALKIIQRRYENKGFSDYKLRVQDDYTIIAEIPDTDEDADNVFEKLALSGMLTFRSSASTANSRNVLMEGTSEYIKSVEVSGSDETYYVVLNFTKAGRKEFTKITTELAASSSSDSSSGSSSGASLYVFMGTEQLMNVSVTEAIDQNYVAISGFTTRSTATSVSVVLDTALHESDRFDLTFTNSGAASFTATMGEHAALYIAIAFGVAILAMIVAFLIRYRQLPQRSDGGHLRIYQERGSFRQRRDLLRRFKLYESGPQRIYQDHDRTCGVVFLRFEFRLFLWRVAVRFHGHRTVDERERHRSDRPELRRHQRIHHPLHGNFRIRSPRYRVA